MQLLAHSVCFFRILLRQLTAITTGRLTPAVCLIVHIHFSMFNNIFKSAPAAFISLTSLALITIGAGAVTTSLHSATARQCANHLWPASAHATHIEWCQANGYQVKLGPGF